MRIFKCFHTSRVEPGNGQLKVGPDKCGKSLQLINESGGSNPNKTRILLLGTKEAEEYSMLKNFYATFSLSNMVQNYIFAQIFRCYMEIDVGC